MDMGFRGLEQPRLLPERPDQLLDAFLALAHDAAGPAGRRQRYLLGLEPRRLQRDVDLLHFLLLGRHDALERCVARLVEALLAGDDGGESALAHLETALDLAL